MTKQKELTVSIDGIYYSPKEVNKILLNIGFTSLGNMKELYEKRFENIENNTDYIGVKYWKNKKMMFDFYNYCKRQIGRN